MTGFPRVGETFAGYRLDGVLGRGGMSTVFRAENVRLGNIVALKVLSPELADDDQFRERFVRESRVASSMNHPNIIPITDAGQEAGHLYIVMRFVNGSDLKSVLHREGRLDTTRCLEIISQVASALDAAHAKTLLHRDVKPANILLESSGVDYRGDHVYLSDFGLTKHTGSTSGLTKTGHFVGTIDYMAPEQIEDGSIDGRADIYALGCVTFECLTGSVPFARDSDAAVLLAHLRDDLQKATAHRPELSEKVDDLIARALAKSPEDRYQGARELVIDLSEALDAVRSPRVLDTVKAPTPAAPLTTGTTSHPASAGPLSSGVQPPLAPPTPPSEGPTPEREGKPSRRQVSLLAAAGISVAVLILVGGGALVGVLLSRDSESAKTESGATVTESDTAMTDGDTGGHTGEASGGTLEEIIPRTLFANCAPAESRVPGAVETVTCLPPSRADSLEVVLFEKPHELMAAYHTKVESTVVQPRSGKCSGTDWGGERPWEHAVHGGGSADGRVLCYLHQGDSFVTWTVAGSNVLATAMTDGENHGDLYRWWSFWHHQLV